MALIDIDRAVCYLIREHKKKNGGRFLMILCSWIEGILEDQRLKYDSDTDQIVSIEPFSGKIVMDYEKKYKELIERFDVLLNLNTVKESGTLSVDDIRKSIPELAESEDEGIRKRLISYFKSQVEAYGDENHEVIRTYNKWIAWLEKEGEQKSEWSDEDDEHAKSITSTIEYCKAKYPNSPSVIEAYNSDLDWLKSLRDKVLPQKQEWSEEDEKGLGDALWCCKQAASIAKDENDMGNAWYAEKWLKSLKDRVQPHQKPEWGEEDETNYNRLLHFLNGGGLIGGRREELFDWLKSLRPQNQWKPSEEQIRTLEYYMHALSSNEHKEVLFGLMEQLKAL